LLSPKADTHFTIPQRVEGQVDLDGWLYAQTVYLRVSSHQVQCRLTTLIEVNALTTTLRHHLYAMVLEHERPSWCLHHK